MFPSRLLLPWRSRSSGLPAMLTLALGLCAALPGPAQAQEAAPGEPGKPYAQMPKLAPIGVRVDRYLPLPPAAPLPPRGW